MGEDRKEVQDSAFEWSSNAACACFFRGRTTEQIQSTAFIHTSQEGRKTQQLPVENLVEMLMQQAQRGPGRSG